MSAISLAWCLLTTVGAAAEPPVRSDQAYPVTFPAEQARCVRFVIEGSSSSEPCIDELEVYGPEGKQNLALAKSGAKATASSCLSGYAGHAIEHLNDGQYGNDHSWIAAGTGREWAQIELPKPAKIAKVVFSRDRKREYADRVPIRFEVQVSGDGQTWKTVKKVATTAAPVAVRRGPGSGGFAGVVPGPPPPPRVEKDGVVVAQDGAWDVEARRQDALGFANLALDAKAKPAASSVLPGHAIHQIAHLGDGKTGNAHSWISNGEPSWAEIDLGEEYWVYNVAFGSDSSQQHRDRAATTFSILTATQYDVKSEAPTWTAVYKESGGAGVHVRRELKFKPVRARWVRIAVDASSGGNVRIDEIEVFGQSEPIPLEKIGPLPEHRLVESKSKVDELLEYAFLAEEHAWLKGYGRADLAERLLRTPYPQKRYPPHVGDDRLPLPPLSGEPKLDGVLDDACWGSASRGVVRVADPYDFEAGPLVEHTVTAGHKDGNLLLAIETNRLLSSHIAVVSTSTGNGCGVVAYTKKGLVLNTYEPEGRSKFKLKQSTPVEGAFNETLTCCEIRLPLSLFPDCQAQGIRVGLGMGGRHTGAAGRPVCFSFSPLSIAEVSPCVDRAFRVRLALAAGAKPIKLEGDSPELTGGISLGPGQSKTISIPADRGPIGSEHTLRILDDAGDEHVLNLFRYDPLERTLVLLEEMIERFAAKERDVGAERAEAAEFRRRQKKLLASSTTDVAAERAAFFEARAAKRRLFLREPDLGPIGRILFVKRQAFRPSHNYSVLLDSAWRPGGGIHILDVPRRDGRFEPGEGKLTEVFNSGEGISRNPMANFDLSKIYFAYRRAADEYYDIHEMKPDGSGLKRLTHGPFHDYWPCPLPDGGLCFISTRCRSRYLCWRPQAAVLFRMDGDGENMRPLSFANLTEWGPSVMSDGRIIWQRSEYQDKGADYAHTLWTIRPDGTKPELIFGNTVVLPQGYANGREVPGSNEICCTMISHFGDLNGPIALLDIDKGRFNPKAITSITPEIPWPGYWPTTECFRDPVPIATDYFLCSHAPRDRFGLYVIDRFGNREMVYLDETVGSMCPTPYRVVPTPPVLGDLKPCAVTSTTAEATEWGQIAMADVYQGIDHVVPRGSVKYIRVAQEVRAELLNMPDGTYQRDHTPFMHWYATPVDKISGPHGWPSYVAKGTWGLAPVEEDGSAHFYAPAGKVLYFQVLDKDFNELQRMRSVCQLQPGEQRSCIGCHEDRRHAPAVRQAVALRRAPSKLEPPPWGAGPFSYTKAVQPVWDAKCVRCHDAKDKQGFDLTGTLDVDRIPASYKTVIRTGWVHYLPWGYQAGVPSKAEPLTFGTLKSKLWKVLDAGHYDVKLTTAEMRAVKCWTDLNCPLWPDYIFREDRPGPELKPKLTQTQ